MSQLHRIIKSFRDLVGTTEALTNVLSGGMHHGERVDTTTAQPFARIEVKQTGRETYSGGALVEYQAKVTITAGQKVGTIGDAQAAFSDAFDYSHVLPSVTGRVVIVWPEDATIVEDPNSVFGEDILVSTQSWLITIQEP